MTTSEAHVTKVITICNGGSKARRAVCGCGWLGARTAYGPGRTTITEATARAELRAAEHVAEVSR